MEIATHTYSLTKFFSNSVFIVRVILNVRHLDVFYRRTHHVVLFFSLKITYAQDEEIQLYEQKQTLAFSQEYPFAVSQSAFVKLYLKSSYSSALANTKHQLLWKPDSLR